jgi:hypothetical protein
MVRNVISPCYNGSIVVTVVSRRSSGTDIVAVAAIHKILLQNIMSVVIEEGPKAMNIATISAGFEKGDFLVREEQGNRVYFDFFEEVCTVTLFCGLFPKDGSSCGVVFAH